MNVNALLTDDIPARNQSYYQPVPTASTPHSNGSAMTPKSLSPNTGIKAVSFLLRDSPNEPKPFQIRPHDTTDSIMDTVKHLMGVSRQWDLGVSLEDSDGLSFIPSYENFIDGMTVYVRIEESLPHNFAHRHSYNLRQSNGSLSNGARSYNYPASRSVSPNSRGRRSTSATAMNGTNGRTRSLKRSALHQDADDDPYAEDYLHDSHWYSLPHQQLLPDDEEEPRTKAGSVASADISVENILEGSRRKRPKFSSDELPLFPPPALPKQNGSVSSLSPSRQIGQLATPYTQRHFSFSHPTPPSNAGDYAHGRSHSVQLPRGFANGIVPTPAPTVTSCISDEDVAMQLMRLGNANSGSNSAMDEHREGFISDGGDMGDEDDGRSDTTELPDGHLPPIASARYALPDSPILFPNNQREAKTLDEILPSFDTTEPSDDENQPPEDAHQISHIHHTHTAPHSLPSITNCDDGEQEMLDDEADETYIAREEDDNDRDYDDDLDDVPLKMRREKKLFTAAASDVSVKPKPHTSKGIAKIIKRPYKPMQAMKVRPPDIISARPNQIKYWIKPQPHSPISPASPPASRKPSVSSSVGNKSRPLTSTAGHGFGTPSSQENMGLPTIPDGGLSEEPQRPRCQRCRKSKKGCDRQRPCQRCKDAGIPEDQCISEDEAGTRRGRQAAAAAKRASMANGVVKPKQKKKKVV